LRTKRQGTRSAVEW